MTENRKRTVGIQTLGCRLNQYESDGLMQKFLSSGRYASGRVEDGPDIAILNSCTVTDQADARNRQAIRSIRRRNPRSRIIVTGCFAQTDPDKARGLPGVSLVVGNDRKAGLFEIVEELLAGGESDPNGGSDPRRGSDPVSPVESGRIPSRKERPVLNDPFGYGAVLPFGHTRAYLKIQDGCDRNCSYCKIPQARGRGTSRRMPEILDELRRLEDRGVPEVVLTGVNLGWYRDREGGVRFANLLERMLETLRRTRLRLSSIEPCDVDAALGEISCHPLFCDFLHVPLQSGSREILRRMRRTYNPTSFRRRIETVLARNPGLFLGTDVIVGFPGESETDFQASLQLCEDLGMANIHAFRFSARTGTEAAALGEWVQDSVVRERMTRLAELKGQGWRAYAEKQIGRRLQAAVEHGRDGEEFGGRALTGNFLRLAFDQNTPGAPRPGGLHDFHLREIAGQRILAEVVPE